MEKLKAALGEREKLSFAAADVSKPETLKECLVNARGVIYAASGKGYFSAAEVDNKVLFPDTICNDLWSRPGLARPCVKIRDYSRARRGW